MTEYFQSVGESGQYVSKEVCVSYYMRENRYKGEINELFSLGWVPDHPAYLAYINLGTQFYTDCQRHVSAAHSSELQLTGFFF